MELDVPTKLYLALVKNFSKCTFLSVKKIFISEIKSAISIDDSYRLRLKKKQYWRKKPVVSIDKGPDFLLFLFGAKSLVSSNHA